MASRDFNDRDSELEVEDLLPEHIFYPIEPEKVSLVLLKDLNLHIVGKVTGIEYVFHRAGATVDVDKRDAEIMLSKTSGSGCCSGTPGSPYFEIAR